MYSKIKSCGLLGINGYIAEVETDINNGIPAFEIVGLGDAAIREARERVRSAVKNAGFEFPVRRITMNLAPANLKKEGSSFDLAIALGILSSSGVLDFSKIQDSLFIGELSLDGEVKPVKGILPIAVCALQNGIRSLVLPASNAKEASVVRNIEIIPVASLSETIEHIEAFKDYNNYVWMTMEDLHAVADGVSHGILNDTGLSHYINDNLSEDSEISVFRNYNRTKIEEYKAAMKKVDFNLGLVFDYIRKNYKPEEYVVTLNSDHGQKFIEEDDYMFTQLRTNVPFMMAGRNVIKKNSDELMSNVDIVPTLLQVCGLPCEDGIDGKVIKDFGGMERAYTVTESIFSGQTYKLAMNDKEHLFTFETKEFTRNDGLIPIKDYTVKLQNRATGEDETDKYPGKVESCCEAAYDHIKSWAYLEQ
jgi:hypothetical protein